MSVALLGVVIFVISLLRALVRAARSNPQPNLKLALAMAVVALVIGVVNIVGIVWLLGAEDPLNVGPPPHDEATAIALGAIYPFALAVMGIAVIAMVITAAIELGCRARRTD